MEGSATGCCLCPSPETLASSVWDGLVAGFSQLPDGRKGAARVNHFRTGMVANSPVSHLNRPSQSQPPLSSFPRT